MMTLTLTWAMFKWSGLVLFILGVIGLVTGSLPDNGRRPMGDLLRWVSWPLFIVWLAIIMYKGLSS